MDWTCLPHGVVLRHLAWELFGKFVASLNLTIFITAPFGRGSLRRIAAFGRGSLWAISGLHRVGEIRRVHWES
jgi:hypothetical protein